MKATSYLVCFVVTLSATANVSQSNQEGYWEQFPNFLRDFVNYQEFPSQVILFSCCKAENLSGILKDATFPIGHYPCNIERSLDDSKRNSLVFVIDLKCPTARKFIENEIDPKYYAHPFRWLMLCENFTSVPNINALPDSNIYLISPGNFEEYFEIRQFYKTEANSSIIFEPYGSWSSLSGINATQEIRILSRRRRNLKRKVLTASVVITNNDTLNHLEDYKDKHIDSVTKVNFPITKYLIDTVNGTMRFIPTETWGYQNPETGEWNGMIGDLLAKRAQIGGTALFVTAVRIPVLDYISMTSPTEVQFIFREPPLSYVTNIYSLPFTGLVWISAIAVVILAVIIISATIKFQMKIVAQKNNHEENLRLSDFILVGISAACQMGTFLQPKFISARVSTIFLLVTVLFLYTSYTANIVSLLQSTTKSIKTLSDLLNSQLDVGVENTSYNRYYFPTTTEPVRKAFYQKKVLHKGVPKYMNISEGIARIREGLFAFNVELGVGYKLIEESFFEHEKCNLKLIPFIQVSDIWYGIEKNSPYKEILKVSLFKIREFGLQKREHARIYTKKPVCASTGQSFGSVRLTDCYAAITMLLIGYGLAVLILFLERMCKDCKICLL